MRRLKLTTIGFFMSLAVLFLMNSCSGKKAKQAMPLEIPVVEVKVEHFPLIQDFVGQTFGYFDISIRARVEGYLEGVHFQEGGRVKKGQLLYTIDSDPFDAKVAEALSRVAEAKTRLVQAEGDFARIKPLAESNAVSQSDLDAAIATLGAAEAGVEAAQAQLKFANIEKSYTKIHSPISGIIGRTEAKTSEFVGRDPNPVVLNAVSRIDTILVQFTLSEMMYLELVEYAKKNENLYKGRGGDEADIKLLFADDSEHPYPGRVDFIDRNIDPTTGTIMLQASFPNPDFTARPGLFAKIRAIMDDSSDRIVIPHRCLQELQGQYNVLVVNDKNEVKFRTVEIAQQHGDLMVIKSGLNVGEKVLLEGFTQVKTGMTIVPKITEFKSVTKQTTK
ncbi:efflux RND transporter periplasmic adaptor subunit [Labilibacter marinus]|uniref:efflux RND transporter periplasmic adaptor subunit n=1 Tax=Labilibacter marinus TaxID=1477105 RepID=UPI0009F99CBB|nr:efflux RND transporter periplasmic adaptor subunit [Labilibacter marinus]